MKTRTVGSASAPKTVPKHLTGRHVVNTSTSHDDGLSTLAGTFDQVTGWQGCWVTSVTLIIRPRLH